MSYLYTKTDSVVLCGRYAADTLSDRVTLTSILYILAQFMIRFLCRF